MRGRRSRQRHDHRAPRLSRRQTFIAFLGVFGLVLLVAGYPAWQVLVVVLVSGVLLRTGFRTLGMFVRPAPEPPPPGEMRRVKIAFRCSICGTEVRMTAAPDEDPEPPRHCSQDMDLVAPID